MFIIYLSLHIIPPSLAFEDDNHYFIEDISANNEGDNVDIIESIDAAKFDPLPTEGLTLEYVFRMARLGHPEAQMKLGYFYARGIGVEQDYVKSFEWSMKGAKQGNMKAQFNIGISYMKGQGVSIDKKKAEKWLRKSADQGDEDAKDIIGMFDAKKYSTKSAVYYVIKNLAEKGDLDAMYKLGKIYAHGNYDAVRDINESIKWYKTAADNNHAASQYMMSGIVTSNEERFEWNLKAAKNGHREAQRNVAIFYGTADDTPFDLVEAYAWMQVAKASGASFSKESEDNLTKSVSLIKSDADNLANKYKKLYGGL